MNFHSSESLTPHMSPHISYMLLSLTCCLFEATIRSGKLNPRSVSWLRQAHIALHCCNFLQAGLFLPVQGLGHV